MDDLCINVFDFDDPNIIYEVAFNQLYISGGNEERKNPIQLLLHKNSFLSIQKNILICRSKQKKTLQKLFNIIFNRKQSEPSIIFWPKRNNHVKVRPIKDLLNLILFKNKYRQHLKEFADFQVLDRLENETNASTTVISEQKPDTYGSAKTSELNFFIKF